LATTVPKNVLADIKNGHRFFVGTRFCYDIVLFGIAAQSRNNFLTSAMLEQVWHCDRFVII